MNDVSEVEKRRQERAERKAAEEAARASAATHAQPGHPEEKNEPVEPTQKQQTKEEEKETEAKTGSKQRLRSSSVIKVDAEGNEVLSDHIKDDEVPLDEFEGQLNTGSPKKRTAGEDGEEEKERIRLRSSSHVKLNEKGEEVLSDHLKPGEKVVGDE